LVRCKIKVIKKGSVQGDGSVTEVVMEPVYGGSPENEKFFKYTPCGQFNFGTINAEAAAQLEEGKEYYIDISPAIE
jgi:hypothetical protein